jgi:hypothetical protein
MWNPIARWIDQTIQTEVLKVRANQRRTLPLLQVATADYLREVGHDVAQDLRNQVDPVERLTIAYDRVFQSGQDDVADGLATLACDVMLTHVTGTRIVNTLYRMADQLAPPA